MPVFLYPKMPVFSLLQVLQVPVSLTDLEPQHCERLLRSPWTRHMSYPLRLSEYSTRLTVSTRDWYFTLRKYSAAFQNQHKIFPLLFPKMGVIPVLVKDLVYPSLDLPSRRWLEMQPERPRRGGWFGLPVSSCQEGGMHFYASLKISERARREVSLKDTFCLLRVYILVHFQQRILCNPSVQILQADVRLLRVRAQLYMG